MLRCTECPCPDSCGTSRFAKFAGRSPTAGGLESRLVPAQHGQGGLVVRLERSRQCRQTVGQSSAGKCCICLAEILTQRREQRSSNCTGQLHRRQEFPRACGRLSCSELASSDEPQQHFPKRGPVARTRVGCAGPLSTPSSLAQEAVAHDGVCNAAPTPCEALCQSS